MIDQAWQPRPGEGMVCACLVEDRVGLTREQLPLLWDCDFMFGEPGAGNGQLFVLCDVSSVSPFPPSSIAPLVVAVKARLGCCWW